jgi:hypothetical protein
VAQLDQVPGGFIGALPIVCFDHTAAFCGIRLIDQNVGEVLLVQRIQIGRRHERGDQQQTFRQTIGDGADIERFFACVAVTCV